MLVIASCIQQHNGRDHEQRSIKRNCTLSWFTKWGYVCSQAQIPLDYLVGVLTSQQTFFIKDVSRLVCGRKPAQNLVENLGLSRF